MSITAKFYALIEAIHGTNLEQHHKDYLIALLEDELQKELHLKMALQEEK